MDISATANLRERVAGVEKQTMADLRGNITNADIEDQDLRGDKIFNGRKIHNRYVFR